MPSKDKKKAEMRGVSNLPEMKQRFKRSPFVFLGTIFILVIVVVAFVFIPAMVPQAGGIMDFTFGYYNRTPIQIASDNYFDQVRRNLEWQHQQWLSDDPTNAVRHWVWRMAFQEAVVHLGIQDEVRRAGLVVPDNVVDREMARQFTVDGRFDVVRYRAMDNATRMSMWRQTRESIAVAHYIADLASLRVSSAEMDFIGAMSSPRRSFSIVGFSLDAFPDSEVIAFAQANPDPYRVTHLSRITLDSEWEAQQLLDNIRNGVITFEEAAMASSVDALAEIGGEMGMLMAYELTEIWMPAERETVITLASGELSEIVSVAHGWLTRWAFFKANEDVQPLNVNDPLQIGRARNHIMANFRGTVEDWVLRDAQSFVTDARERGFGEVVAERNLLSRDFGPIPVNFGDSGLFTAVSTVGIPEIQHAGRDQFFWEAAFGTPLLTPSNPFVVGDNILVLFPLEEVYADEDETAFIGPAYFSMVMDHLSRSFPGYFLTNDRLDDRFSETFWRLWGTN